MENNEIQQVEYEERHSKEGRDFERPQDFPKPKPADQRRQETIQSIYKRTDTNASCNLKKRQTITEKSLLL